MYLTIGVSTPVIADAVVKDLLQPLTAGFVKVFGVRRETGKE
jgi:hypothetical protein